MERDGVWKRINTLKHYGIRGGALFRLVRRKEHAPPGKGKGDGVCVCVCVNGEGVWVVHVYVCVCVCVCGVRLWLVWVVGGYVLCISVPL